MADAVSLATAQCQNYMGLQI